MAERYRRYFLPHPLRRENSAPFLHQEDSKPMGFPVGRGRRCGLELLPVRGEGRESSRNVETGEQSFHMPNPGLGFKRAAAIGQADKWTGKGLFSGMLFVGVRTGNNLRL